MNSYAVNSTKFEFVALKTSNIKVARSLFSSLLTYRPRATLTPEENFFSEAFAAVLQRNPRHCTRLFETLAGRCDPPVTLATQVCFPSSHADGVRDQVDLVLRDEKQYAIYIESKIGSTQGETQLLRYWDTLKRNERSGTLAFITRGAESHPDGLIPTDSFRFVKTEWGKVHRTLRGVDAPAPAPVLVDELLAFMEDLGMTSDISLGDLAGAVTFSRVESKIGRVLDHAWEQCGLNEYVKGNTTGNWIYSSSEPVGSSVNRWTSIFLASKVRLVFGFHTDTSHTGPLGLASLNSQLPIGFVGVYGTGDARWSEQLVKLHRVFLSGKSNWEFAGDGKVALPWIARKQIEIEKANLPEFGEYLVGQLAEGLGELRGGPLFDSPGA